MNRGRSLLLIIVNVITLFACGDDPVETVDNDTTVTLSDSGTTREANIDSSAGRAAGSESGVDQKPDQGFEETDAGTKHDAASETDVDRTPYQGFEERYILTGDDDPVDVCRVRYELHVVGEPSVSCAECTWDILVERRNPTVIVDVDDACANSDLALDAEAITAGEGERVAYGYVNEFMGHSSVLVRLDRERGTWEAVTFATWSDTTGDFSYDRRDGFCRYGGEAPPFVNQGICGLSGEAVVSD